MGNSDTGSVFGVLIALPFIAAIYFLPTIIALRRHHAYRNIILGLNIFAFTGFFWLGSFVWAVWPAEKSIVDPVLGNVTGTGTRNVGDTVGAVGYGMVRGIVQEHADTPDSMPVKNVTNGVRAVGGAAAGAAATWTAKNVSRNDDSATLDQLRKLGELRASGTITEDEFQAMKSRLLS